jgi:hypothetical protein
MNACGITLSTVLLTHSPYFEKIKQKEAYEFILLSVRLCVPLSVTRQQLCNHVPAGTNTHATIEELLGAMFLLRFVSYSILNM